VVFTNDDLLVDEGTIRALAEVVASGRADVAVPAIADSTGAVERTIAPVPSVGALALEWMLLPDRPVRGMEALKVEKWRQPTGVERVDAAMGAIVAVRRDVLWDQPLPVDYFLYWEESEWFWRLRQADRRVEYHPELRVTHDGGRDVRTVKSRLLARNAVRCIRRTQGPRAAAAAWPIVVAWNLRLLLVDALRCARWPSTDNRAVLRARAAGVNAALGAVSEIWRTP
jgi:GT2 family glycosyltransferase